MANVNFNSWEFTQRIIRIGHNREVNRWFKDVPDNNTNNGRAALKAGLKIYNSDSAQKVIAKMHYFQIYVRKLKGVEAVATVPEDYDIRVESKRPQLVIIYRATSKTNKSGNYSLVIPHYSGDRTPKIKPYTKGNHWAILVLKDNSKLVINGQSETESLNYLRDLKKFIDKKYLTNKIKTGVYPNKPFKELTVKPIRADFYPKGKEEMFPLWRHYL